MNEIQLFSSPEFGEIRTLEINGEPWFVGKDIAEVLGYSNSRKAISDHVDAEDKTDGVTIRDSIGREQTPVLINESGMYSLILSSKLPTAKQFKHWVTSEVLPAIRKYGSYTHSIEAKKLKIQEDFAAAQRMEAEAKLLNAQIGKQRLLLDIKKFEREREQDMFKMPIPNDPPVREKKISKDLNDRMVHTFSHYEMTPAERDYYYMSWYGMDYETFWKMKRGEI